MSHTALVVIIGGFLLALTVALLTVAMESTPVDPPSPIITDTELGVNR